MPLARFEVRNEYGLGAQELYKEADSEEPKAILDGVAVAGLVGILRQLGDLAEFAAEVFHGLQEQVVSTACRSHKMLVRVQHIEAALPPLEKAVLAQKSHIHFAYTAGCEWHPKIRVKQKHFIHSDLPCFIMDSYEECHDPPRLHLLDRFDTHGHGACLKRYSDPSFFRKAIARSEPTNAEKVQREKRVRKSKKLPSRWRNGVLSHVVSTSQCSGRMQFGSPNSYGQSSTGETISTVHMTSRSEQGDPPMSFDSRTKSGSIESVFEKKSSRQQEDKDLNKLPEATLKTQDSNATDSVLPGENKLGSDDTMTRGSLQDLNSCSVTWDEKTEIVGPKNHQSDQIVGDEGGASKLPRGSSDLAKELSEAATQRNIDPEDIVCVSADIAESLSEVDEFDEADSEPDRYADALNSLESEAETDFECQTKREIEEPLATLKNEGIDTGEMHMTVQKSEISNVEFRTEPYSSSNKQMSPNYCNFVSSEDVVGTPQPQITAIPSDPDVSVDIYLSEGTGDLNVSRVDGCKSSIGDPSSSLSSVPNSQPPLYSTSNVYEGSFLEVSEASSVNVWTNGGLLGLEPSKPPDHSMSNDERHNSTAFAEENANDLSINTVLPESHLNRLSRKVDSLVKTPDMINPNDPRFSQLSRRKQNMTRTVDNSDSCASYHDKPGDGILHKDSLERLSTVSKVGLGKSKDSCQSCSCGNVDGRDFKETGVVTSQSEVPVELESRQKNNTISLSMFGLGQRFRGNGYQRTESVPEKTPKYQLQNGSPVNSLPSSPPLEHMKISFHPLDGFETSKLRLKFPGGHRFHESIKDVIFPSFQLLPEHAILMQDNDSESENDTFCRSSPYLSEEFMSQHSESSSEQWESDDTPDSKDHEIYDALRRVYSVESISSGFELEEISNGSHIDNSFQSPQLDNGIKKFHHDALFDLPGFDTVSSLASQQVRNCDSVKKDHPDSELQYPKDPVPPPPPLPPVEWLDTKPDSGEAENQLLFTSKVDDCPNNLLVLEPTSQSSKPDPPKLPDINDITDCFLRSEQDQQKLYGSKEVSHAENFKDTDEREDLLNQIRSKSFSLRRTIPMTPTLSQIPTTNNKVAAMLEKANTIRQAYLGSDEGGGDENWSDG